MARIREFQEGTQSITEHRTEVACAHQTLLSDEGQKLPHLSTFGSADRVSGPKSSQSLQLDESSARALVAIIKDAFPNLRTA
ncbi:hypothetical protein QKG38_10485 [Clavibacter michiganensis]|nr:hypothetical protein [Clavibacter michiganensis]MWJ01186.1 hypothetical protein [Clavibacter michiganensis subsp. michiganensis]MDO4041894.1 hypothetical protein [Clavibacter michiganensis]MDO4078711.1 hypothetical protein [Clavibacter michiganensis]MDO4094264.1 hypothetical protein [Clavibacter michiganensis]MWJ24835.1 hypothetical protein [Clavibacter michiganensis subsp. michiganensis]